MAPKPKGLRASKRAAPFDPAAADADANSEASAAAPAPTASSSTSASTPTSTVERTYPHDEDCLTLSDLYELRLTVVDLLYPYPTDLAISRHLERDKLDEARAFLRGILHGCAVLEQYVKRHSPRDRSAVQEGEDARSDARVEARRTEAGQDKLDALGLKGGDDHVLTEGMILYLQAWSLHHLGEIFDDDEAAPKAGAVAAARLEGSRAAKKRKVDLDEPRTKIEWLEAGLAKYEIAIDDAKQKYGPTRLDRERSLIVISLTMADQVRCRTSLARAHLDRCDAASTPGARNLAEAWRGGLEALGDEWDEKWAIGFPEPDCIELGDVVLAQLRTWADTVSFVEEYSVEDRDGDNRTAALERLLKGPTILGDEDLSYLERVSHRLRDTKLDDALDGYKKHETGARLADPIELWKWLASVVAADADMVSFIKMEDALEAKYRPEDDDEDEDEDEDDQDEEQGEVKELPMDADDVKLVKKAGATAIAAIRKTLKGFASLPASVAHPAAKDAQYRKLEEVLLIASALVNPSDVSGTARIEQEIETVRKEGRLADDVDQEDAKIPGGEK